MEGNWGFALNFRRFRAIFFAKKIVFLPFEKMYGT